MPGGRPTKYTEECIERAQQYIQEWEAQGDAIPSQAGLAVYLGVSLSCVEKWGQDKNKQAFLRVLDEIEARQQLTLVNKGLKNEYNSNIVKLVLGKHGFKEQSASELTGKDGKPIEGKWTVEVVSAGKSKN